MLMDYVVEGGRLMLVLAAILFAVLFLVLYAGFLLTVEIRRARRFRSLRVAGKDWDLERLHLAAFRDSSLPARYVSRLVRDVSVVGRDAAGLSERRQRAQATEDALVGEATWPIDLLQFLGAYAAKVGLCGTILGLCMHFLVFGTDASAQVASRAMAVALYTTLGALAIALFSEPAAYVLGWGERWVRGELQRWRQFVEDLLLSENLRPEVSSPPALPQHRRAKGEGWKPRTQGASRQPAAASASATESPRRGNGHRRGSLSTANRMVRDAE